MTDHLRLLFDDGHASVRMKVASESQLAAACRVMLVERDTPHAHRLLIERGEGGNVTARARMGAR